MTDSDGKWTPPPEIPGSVRSLKRLLDECRKKNVAMYDVVEAARAVQDTTPGPWQEALDNALESYDKVMENG
jgi:hypothetical protein